MTTKKQRKIGSILIAFVVGGTGAAFGDDVVVDKPGYSVFFAGAEDIAYLGVQLEEETDYEEGGARITEVIEGSPADAAGLAEGDIVIEFDGVTIRGPMGLTKRIRERDPGETVSITVRRDGRSETFEVELGDRSDIGSFTFAPGSGKAYAPLFDREKLREQLEKSRELLEQRFGRLECEGEDCSYRVFGPFGRPRLGVQLVETTPELRLHLGGDEESGVLVSKVLAGTPAQAAGVQVGDLIVRVGGENVASSSELRRALDAKAGETFELEVVREGRAVMLEVTLPDPDEDAPTGPRAWAPRVPLTAAQEAPAGAAPAPSITGGPLPPLPMLPALPPLPALPDLPPLPVLPALPPLQPNVV